MITWTLVLIGLLLIAIGCMWWASSVDEIDSTAPLMIGACALLCFFSIVIIVPTHRFKANRWMASYKAAQSTLQQSRKDSQLNPLEFATIQQKVIHLNMELATNKYYANLPFFAMYYPSKILKLKPLK